MQGNWAVEIGGRMSRIEVAGDIFLRKLRPIRAVEPMMMMMMMMMMKFPSLPPSILFPYIALACNAMQMSEVCLCPFCLGALIIYCGCWWPGPPSTVRWPLWRTCVSFLSSFSCELIWNLALPLAPHFAGWQVSLHVCVRFYYNFKYLQRRPAHNVVHNEICLTKWEGGKCSQTTQLV